MGFIVDNFIEVRFLRDIEGYGIYMVFIVVGLFVNGVSLNGFVVGIV